MLSGPEVIKKQKKLNKNIYKKVNALLRLIICLFASTNVGYAQFKDTLQLYEVNINVVKLNTEGIGKKVQAIDSLTRELFSNQTLADLISLNSPVFIKNYGPGSISTTSFRGGNAQQTAILWNGLNIQNSMLGQFDLSSVTNNLFNDLLIEHGGSGSTWGSGSVGGSIHLNNKHVMNEGIKTGIQYMYGNTGLNSVSPHFSYSKNKLSIKLNSFAIRNNNHFNYYDIYSETYKTQKQSAYENFQIIPEIKYLINQNHSLTLSTWFAKNNRNFPSIGNYKATQTDANNRVSLNWSYYKNKFTSTVKAAALLDELNYKDSITKIDSRSKMSNYILENDFFYNWRKNQVMNFGCNYTYNQAVTNNYSDTKDLGRLAAIIGNKGTYLKNKLIYKAVFRIEKTSTGQMPYTYNSGIEYAPVKNLTLKINGAKLYRLPTLNDLYWNPGGNINLKPEEGYSTDGTIEFEKQYHEINLLVSASAFDKVITNWILWVPEPGGIATPKNIQRVWSRGSETSFQLTFKQNKFLAQLKFVSGYVISTPRKTQLENDNSIDKQLIYTPRYNYNTNLNVRYQNFVISIFHQYVGYRFTTSDNSEWLEPYHYVTLRGMYHHQLKNIRLGIFANLNNLLNANYQVINNRPMPLQNVEFGISINFINPNKS